MTDHPPIPPVTWQKLLAFLDDGKTGEVVLKVHRGRVTGAKFHEDFREVDTPQAPVLHSR